MTAAPELARSCFRRAAASVSPDARWWCAGGALGVVAAWILVNLTRYYITIPLREAVWELEDSAPDNDSDIAGNVALLVFGWFIPLVGVLIVFLFRYLWRRFRRPAPASDGVQGGGS